MALFSMQQVFVSVVLVLCLFVVMPRIFSGGGKSPRSAKTSSGRPAPQQPRHGTAEKILHTPTNFETPESKTYQSIQQMRNAMEKELKTERTRDNRKDFALTLMPLYAISVGVFALYKFLKMKSQEENLSKKEKNAEEKTKETDDQLLELEQHLAQTEKMLNSLLTQLDPLSSCINTLASEQKDEIMEQLESIRKLMKESGLDKSAMKPQDISHHTCQEKLEDLIQSFSEHPEAKIDEDIYEKCEHDTIFEDTEEFYGIKKYQHFDHEYLLSTMEKPKKMEVTNQDITELNIGLRRRLRNE
ncbi:coiled-coil domain-containing protein 107 [Protobothrops mucrosquamatus]|uniref:coiled-coil domain-containing protein 107 n=1 Tax=Protobothrops mucrosquamatus TaxID=103944 RepID=UPI000775F9C3|nr:coiled-coil domain-containing protein 107 [Protobothrops mucrosquamatus]